MPPQLDPAKTICVCKHNGVKVGSIRATDPNASEYIQNLTRQYDGLQVEHEVEDDAEIMRLVRGIFKNR
jgi:hypothetical protein